MMKVSEYVVLPEGVPNRKQTRERGVIGEV